MRYWIGVASKEHVMRGVQGGFAQVCHGKEGPLKQMTPQDWIIYYSPTIKFGEPPLPSIYSHFCFFLCRKVFVFWRMPIICTNQDLIGRSFFIFAGLDDSHVQSPLFKVKK
jgi:hypothetical protein